MTVKSVPRLADYIVTSLMHCCLGQMQKHKQESRSSWKRCVKTKLRASFSKSRWAETLKDLKDWNADFAILASQSLRSGAKQQNHDRKILRDVEQEIAKYNTINEFSRQVYQALERACTKHVEHLAHTCAMVECTKRRGSCSHEVKFQMALAGSSRQRQPIRFVVNSTIDDSSAEEHSALTDQNSGANHGHKRRHGTPPDNVERRKKKSVRFQSSAVQPGLSPPVITSVGPSSMNSRMKNDLCDHLRQCREQPIQSHTCIGILESKIGWRNSVFPASLDGCSELQQAISLDRLISELPRGMNLQEFSIPDRIHLAKTLAVAVLQYQATPWLQMSWKTSDVVFFGTDAKSMLAQTSALTMPHFSARVRSAGGMSANGLSQSDSTPGVRNSLLYSLGIVLLEIAYWKHWECLKQPPKAPHGNGSWYTDLYQARRLVSSNCSDMGGQYNTIVEHLIECEFRCGQDLNISRLQTAVYRDVICPLEELEEGFRALHVGRKGFD